MIADIFIRIDTHSKAGRGCFVCMSGYILALHSIKFGGSSSKPERTFFSILMTLRGTQVEYTLSCAGISRQVTCPGLVGGF